MDLPKWPKTPPTADEMIRYCAALGLYQSAQAVDLVGVTRGQGALGAARLRLNAEQMIANYDRIRLLRALVALAPAAADAEASNMWLAAEGGDSYGECLWEWADEYGLEADRICEASRSALALEGDR